MYSLLCCGRVEEAMKTVKITTLLLLLCWLAGRQKEGEQAAAAVAAGQSKIFWENFQKRKCPKRAIKKIFVGQI